MSLRFNAINHLLTNADTKIDASLKVTGIFGSNVFTLKVAREVLSDEALKVYSPLSRQGRKLTGP